MRKILLCVLLITACALSSCSYDPVALEEKNRAERDEKREYIMEQMELRLALKYDGGPNTKRGSDTDEPLFDVFDLEKGSNKAWFQYGVYPATAVSYMLDDGSELFKVRIETDGKKFGIFEDNYYGILYGDEAKEEVLDILVQYPVEEIQIDYEPCEDIIREKEDLKKHLDVWGTWHITQQEEVDRLCELVDILNGIGCSHRLAIYNDITGNASMAKTNISSKEIRQYFE